MTSRRFNRVDARRGSGPLLAAAFALSDRKDQ
jgi:hypothetical protein